MHGCAPGAGGPEGQRNGNYRHGLRTKETRNRLRAMRDLAREVKELTRKVRGESALGETRADAQKARGDSLPAIIRLSLRALSPRRAP
jgi:hypothetical protein